MPQRKPRTPKEMKYPEFELNISSSQPHKKINKNVIRYKPK
jgi:hypothetical protein